MTPNDPAIAVTRMTSFASDPSGGNPAGVVLDAANLDEATMLRIAAEVGYSETAFLTRTGPDEYAVRYFSPQAEVAFCGHATIAAAVHLADQIGPGYRVFQTPQAGSTCTRNPLQMASSPGSSQSPLTRAPPTPP